MANTSHAAHPDHGHAHEVTPLSVYYKVYGALLVLTVVTVGVSFVDLGPVAFAAAMLVALVKAAVVAGYFMHLKYDDKLYTLVFCAGLGFVALFFAFTYADLFTRSDLQFEAGNYEYNRDQRWNDYLLNQPAAPSDAGAAEGAGANP